MGPPDSSASSQPFSAVVLAGGRSVRMGSDKAFLAVGDGVLLGRQLRCLRETGAQQVLISGRAGVDYSSFGARVVYDHRPNAGPLAGVAAALKASSRDLLLVLAVDLPAMTSSMLTKIVALSQKKLGCVPVEEGRFEALAAVYPRAALAVAEEQLRGGDYSMQAFIRAAIAERLVCPWEVQPEERGCFINWNRPADWPSVGR